MLRTLTELVRNTKRGEGPVGVRAGSFRGKFPHPPPCGTFNFTHSLFNLRSSNLQRVFPALSPHFPRLLLSGSCWF